MRWTTIGWELRLTSVGDQAVLLTPALDVYREGLRVHAGLPGKRGVRTQEEGRTVVIDRTSRAEALKGVV